MSGMPLSKHINKDVLKESVAAHLAKTGPLSSEKLAQIAKKMGMEIPTNLDGMNSKMRELAIDVIRKMKAAS